MVDINETIRRKLADSGYEIVDMKSFLKRELSHSSIELDVKGDTIAKKSFLTTSNSIIFIS